MARKRLVMLLELALMVAFAYLLSLFRVGRMPQGGSISLQMLPLFVYALRWGGKPGLVAGGIYSVIKLLLGDPFIIHPLQAVLHFPLAFSAIGLAGFLKHKPMAGVVAGGASRFFFHFLAGMVFFGVYAPDHMNPTWYALVYNTTYMGPEILLSILTVPMVIRRISPEQTELLNWRANALELLSFLVPLTAMAVIVGLRDSYPAINYAALAGWGVLIIYHLVHALRDWSSAKTGLILVSVPPAIVYVAFRLLELF